MSENYVSMPLAFVILWVVLAAAGALLWRSGDPSGRTLVVVPATNGVGAVGMWLNSVGYLWTALDRRFDEVFCQDDGRRVSVIF